MMLCDTVEIAACHVRILCDTVAIAACHVYTMASSVMLLLFIVHTDSSATAKSRDIDFENTSTPRRSARLSIALVLRLREQSPLLRWSHILLQTTFGQLGAGRARV